MSSRNSLGVYAPIELQRVSALELIMRALFGLVLCVSLMFWTSGNAYARGGTYHHAEFVLFSSKMATRKPPLVAEHRQCQRSAGHQPCTR